MISRRFTSKASRSLHQAVLTAGLVALLAWVSYAFAAALQPCPHEADLLSTPAGMSGLMANGGGLQPSSRLQEATGDAVDCCAQLHDGAVAQPSLPALPAVEKLVLTAPGTVSTRVVVIDAPTSARPPRIILPAGTAPYLRTQRLRI